MSFRVHTPSFSQASIAITNNLTNTINNSFVDSYKYQDVYTSYISNISIPIDANGLYVQQNNNYINVNNLYVINKF